ncbi:MAG: NAD-dependent epimerase/dehydratase family protein [Elusimicrobia bacterium]|nr:NAD-dependent epimerase/dehydratase family protein [Elusimicrobiota bacterium]
MKVGVLGGTRFIGFHLVRALLARGDDVTLFSRGLTREPEPFSGTPTRVAGDRDRPGDLEAFLARGFDAIVDLSGYAPRHVTASRVGHYVFCSSSSAYAVPPPSPYTEDAPLTRAAGTYGGDKVLAEDALRASGLPVTIFRPQAVFGPHGAEQALYALRRIAAGAPVLVRPEAAGRRINPLWVGDLVAAFIAAMERPAAGVRTYNAAGPDTVDPAGFVARAATGGRTIVIDSESAAMLPHLGLPWLSHDLVADAGKLGRELGWTPLPLDEALRRTWDWARTEPVRLRFKPQRWERAAAAGRRPGPWVRRIWRLYDAARQLLP